MPNLSDYTNNINPTNTLKDYTPKDLSSNYTSLYPDEVTNLILNSNINDNTPNDQIIE